MILITGANGFVGRHLAKRLRQEGLAVRAVVRVPAKAQALADLGAEVVQGDINDAPSLTAAAQGCDRVVHLVGIIQEGRGFTFRSVHVEGTRNVLDAANQAGVKHFLYQSALGTRENARSEYHTTKFEAEKLVKAGGIPYTILRPSLIYGPGDLFTIRLAEMIKLSPVLPVVGSGRSKIQPVYIEDVASCIVKILADGRYRGKTYEIGGPEQLNYLEVTKAIAGALGVNRPVVHVPMFIMGPMAKLAETFLPKAPVTTDQLIMLQEDTVCDRNDLPETFGIEPVKFREGLAKFLGKTADR
ncbi:MAG TPA: complex I NDUFA9 subunit family protein [Thermoanaerobaculia bacterium]|nr:complex I NDUFA9 subunit family protein [Thermoanaerobaculia bacterium]